MTVVAAAAAAALLGTARPALADLPVRVHAASGIAHDALAPQNKELSWGAAGALSVELPLGRVVGAQAELGAVGLSDGSPPTQVGVTDRGASSALTAMGGLRAQAFDGIGPWADLNGGVARTGSLQRFAFDAHVGYDFAIGHQGTALGPALGYVQVVQPDDQVRPEDAHVVWLGVHLAFGARGARPAAAPPPPPAEKPAPRPIVQEAKAEPPPRADRDDDGVYDDEDACPDVRGVRTGDPKTNGCPPPEGPVHLAGDKIEIDDVILFALDDPRVHPASFGLVKKVAKFILDNTDMAEIDIDGHADETGTEAYNVRLSAARARSVRALLLEYGVPAERVTTHAFGESRPRDPGHNAAAYRQNRRVEFNVVRTRGSDEKSHEQAQRDLDEQEQEKGR